LEALRRKEMDSLIVYSSSGSVYGEPEDSPQLESHKRRPSSPYGVAKLAAEEYLRTWDHLYSMSYIGLRYYNVYGPRQSGDESSGGGVIPIFASRILAGSPLKIDGTGKQERCFTYVSDVVQANIISTMKKNCWGEFFNIASDERIDILGLANLMMEVTGKTVPLEFMPTRLGEIMIFQPSIELAKKKMGYEPNILLKDGLRMYFNWLEDQS
jgi:UDP-glucose 4-epimerase